MKQVYEIVCCKLTNQWHLAWIVEYPEITNAGYCMECDDYIYWFE